MGNQRLDEDAYVVDDEDGGEDDGEDDALACLGHQQLHVKEQTSLVDVVPSNEEAFLDHL